MGSVKKKPLPVSKKFTEREKPSIHPKDYRRWKPPRKNASQRSRAINYLSCARHTARLKSFPDPEKHAVAFDEYESIDDDIEDMMLCLTEAKLTLADIGTDEEELDALREAEHRLNESARRQAIPSAVQVSKRELGDDDI
jgi:hypothetical protein